MRSPRLIAIVYIKDEIVVQSEKFSKYYPIGSLTKTLEYLNNWGVDEIIILSIDGQKAKDIETVSSYLAKKENQKAQYQIITKNGQMYSIIM